MYYMLEKSPYTYIDEVEVGSPYIDEVLMDSPYINEVNPTLMRFKVNCLLPCCLALGLVTKVISVSFQGGGDIPQPEPPSIFGPNYMHKY